MNSIAVYESFRTTTQQNNCDYMDRIAFKIQQQAIYVHWFYQTNTTTQVQRLFTAEYHQPPP